MTDASQVPMPLLITIRGLPGSGKSSIAHALCEAFGNDNAVIVDPDGIDTSSTEYKDMVSDLTAEGVEEKFFPNRYLKQKSREAIDEKKIVIWNQAFTLLDGFERTITNLFEHAEATGKTLPHLVVEVEIDPEVAKARIRSRAKKGGHDVPDDVFERFVRDYKSFADKGYEVVAVKGDADVHESVEKVLEALKNL